MDYESGGGFRGLIQRGLGGLGKAASGLMTNKYGGGIKGGYEAGREFGQNLMPGEADQLADETDTLLSDPATEILRQGQTIKVPNTGLTTNQRFMGRR